MADSLQRHDVRGRQQQPEQGFDESFLPEQVRQKRAGASLSEHLAGLTDQERSLDPQGMYAAAVDDSLNQPLISIKSVATPLGVASKADEYAMWQKYPTGYMSARQYMDEKAASFGRNVIQAYAEKHGEVPQQIKDFATVAAQRMQLAGDDVGGVLAGTLKTNNKTVQSLTNEIKSLVAAHAPGGEFAALGQRTASEDAQLRKERGPNAEFTLTEEGKQNHDAVRAMELWSAQDENYAPASTMAQVQRGLAPIFAAPYNALTGNSNRNVGEPWDEMAMISRPGGKLEYAAHLYSRAGSGDPSSVYTPEGRAKYGRYDVSGNPVGLVNATSESQSYPMGWWKQNVGYPITEIANYIGNVGDQNNQVNIRELRTATNRITPVIPDGVDAEKVRAASGKLNNATARQTGFASAVLGPKFADAYNATLGNATGPTKRTYLSPATQTLVETPGEMAGDLSNFAMNTLLPVGGAIVGAAKGGVLGGIKGAATGGAVSGIRSLANRARSTIDDAFEEQVEGGGLNSAIGSIADYLSPEKTNLLMGSADPNAPGFDKRVMDESTNQRFNQMQAGQEWGDAVGRKPRQNTPMPKTMLPTMLLSR